ncbi:unnamed protein product [Rotaria sordida]|uniref:Protein UNC80 C-terminal domain-containing protein n=2 Tax=Rotaria sordida TaxID=392033 RepID=A0A813TR55_9BILA|nr:unnamed protein product [Rotaria sordida]
MRLSDAARKVLWTCLLDEPTLLIRFFFEKISLKERRIKSFQCLHRLMIYFTDIPPQFAHAIFNYVLGLLLNMVRSPLDGSQELIVNGLTLLWQIIPYLHGLVLKDLKQILRKEQAEMLILVSGNIPSTKKVIIHGPDVSQIPTQAIISEDTQFSNVLQEALEFFGISNLKRDQYYLIDIKTKQIHISDTYVRDFYFFRRNIHPQLSLVYMDIKQSKRELEQMSIFLKTTELSKVLFARYLLENTPFNQIHNCITFFHDELIKSPLFPRKPLESDFNLYTIIHNKELFHLDMLHKYNWTKLIACIFFNMDGKTSTTSDITLFLSVINGSFILHCEDLVMLRFCLATYINIVKHFRHIFATNGYLLIMPTFLHVYSNIQSNPMLKKAIEYCCRQFYILHRIPFILQMLGSISQLFNFDQSINITDTNKIQSIYLFRLLIALEQTNIDIMNDDYFILELVKNNSLTTNRTINIPIGNMSVVAALGQGIMIPPTIIKSLDFCYADDDTIFTFLNCLDVCVTVVAYAPDSIRSLQMLNIIHILLPKYFEYIKDYTNKNDIQKNGRDEIKIIEKLSITIKTLISTTEWLTRTFIEPKCDTSLDGIYKYSRGSYRSASIAIDDDSVNRFIDDRTKSKTQDTDQLKQVSEFRWPRDIFLSIISIFIYFSSQRLNELIKLLHDSTIRMPELLDAKSHIRLADIVHTLLKLASFDPIITCCHGLQNYFQKLLPYTNWSDEQLRSALNHLLRRIDRMFIKICKKQMTKHCFDWEATAGILNGIYLTIDRHPYIAYFPNLKALISGCIALILNENQVDSNHSIPRLNTLIFPKEFSYSVIKLVGRYLLAINHQPNLEALTTNNSWSSVNPSLTLNYLLHFLLPLLLWMSSEQKNVQKIHSNDISYIITILLNSVKSNLKLATTMGTQNLSLGHLNNTGKQYLTSGETILPNINFTHKSMKQLKYLSRTASLLGLKIFIISFSKQIKYEWQRIIRAIKLMCNKQSNISSNLLLFIDFIVSYKTPIYVILRPFLLHYIHSITSENDCDYEIIRNIQQKLMFDKIVPLKSMNEILNELIQELNQLKAELTDESRASDLYDTHPTSTEKIRLDSETHQQMKDSDGITTRMNTMQDGRLNNSLTTNTFNYQQQQQLCDNSLNLSSKKRPEKIRPNEALNILETYYARYRIRCGGDHISQNCTEHLTVNCLSSMTNETTTFISDTSRLRSPSNSHSPMSLLRAVTVTGNRSPTTIDHSFQYYNPMKESFSDKFSIDKEITPQLRTFRGWKRNLAHLDKSRSTKSSGQLSTSKVSTMKYDSTKEMNPIFRPIRQVNEQHSIPVINERSSNSLHVHASHNQTILNSFFDDNINPGDDQASNSCIPLTETVLRQSESDKNALVSRLSNTSPMNVDDEDESQL